MSIILTEEARMVRETALGFFNERSPITELRRLRDTQDPDGFSRALWRQMAELGWTGFLVPEEYGGSAFGIAGLAQVMEAAGRTLTASPLLSTALLGASLVAAAGTEDQKAAILPALVAGEHILALALEEGSRHAPDRIALKAETDGTGYRLTGRKTFVLDGHVADTLIVAGNTGNGTTLFLVPGGTPGVTRARLTLVDSRNAANVAFDGVRIEADSVLGPVGGGAAILEAALDFARAGLAAEMLGSASEAFERTVQYLKDRKQFGVAIGSFQALKHRAAQMFCEVEVTRSAVMAATAALDQGGNDAAALVSLAKAKANQTFFRCGNEGVQMHGGIGMTDEHEIGFFTKRARAAIATFGDTGFHQDRYARLMGY
ncbi:acyl-CoA dehydrogenase family protein [Rhodopila sp.]|uniref:acyl-CoA dehydrogenase family protein n=1 Tax=Rhodopila sp. TaxID=2480087 RepID=UPI002C06170A|nr:acyl-CoA dehydrogenase [Rhodopila sp.]HVZ07288.1 acyl-CoA dehydrogenase [Rhodopila sp.]